MRVAVLGGGLQGSSVALELAGAGVQVDLYDRRDEFLAGASACNEGKLHLGYVYAADRSLNTARTLLRGAIAFAPLLRRWLGSDIDALPRSTPFNYVVHAESQLSIAEIERHLHDCHALAVQLSQGQPLDYFGSDYCAAPRRLSAREAESLFNPRWAPAVFQTAEIGIDSQALAVLIRSRLLADGNIRPVLSSTVRSVTPDTTGAAVEFEKAGGTHVERYDHVVNALWDGRLAIDAAAGLASCPAPMALPPKVLCARSRPGVAETMPSVTIMLGAFGDIVTYASRDVYLSWYPAGMAATSSELRPPPWPLTLAGSAASALRQATFDGLQPIVPGVANLTPGSIASYAVKGGIIVAWGQTDIQDPESELHERYAIGPKSHGRYHTVDTGKLTTAPLFGKILADRILGRN